MFAPNHPLQPLLLLLLLLLLTTSTIAFKPVIMMHGVGSSASEMATIQRLLLTRDNTTIVTSLPLFEGKPASWDHDLQTQIDGVTSYIRALVTKDPLSYQHGYHLVCKSQGALTCRMVIENMNDHNVDTFVSLAGPQQGVFGVAFFQSLKKYGLPDWLIQGTADIMWRVAYNFLGQKISVANIWRDPHHLDEYEKHSIVLPTFTEKATSTMKTNFLRLRRAVFCVGSGSSYDGGIEPWQTGVWGSWNATGGMVNMTEQNFYLEDTFGLKTLDESGRLNLTIVKGARHGDWTGNEDIIEKYVLPHCT